MFGFGADFKEFKQDVQNKLHDFYNEITNIKMDLTELIHRLDYAFACNNNLQKEIDDLRDKYYNMKDELTKMKIENADLKSKLTK